MNRNTINTVLLGLCKRIFLAFLGCCIFGVGSVSASMLERTPNRCNWYEQGTHYLVSRTCFVQGNLPVISPEEGLGMLSPYIVDVTDVYDVESADFIYTDTDVIFSDELQAKINYRSSETWKKQMIDEAGYIVLPKLWLARNAHFNWSISASVRDTSTYGKCRKTNYDVAMRELNGYVLDPGKLLNMNKLIANKPGYCTGGGNFLFYQGACGGSTQLFWNGMLNPYLQVTKRYAHGMRYAGFYGSKILGDDASMYQRGKQLEVKNISDYSITFGTFVRPSDGNTVLLSAYPEKHELSVRVQKQQTGKRSAVVINNVFDEMGGLRYEQKWTSNYRSIDTSTDETIE